MIPNLFTLLEADPAVRSLLGEPLLRVFPWSEAPEKIQYPYATYGVFSGNPENYLGQVPDTDKLGTQVDVWAKTGDSCLAVAKAIRDAIEPTNYLLNVSSTERDRETGSYHIRMDFDFYTPR